MTIASFVGREYGLDPTSVVAASGGVEADVWRLDDALCLKWFRRPVDRTVVERTLLMDRLARRGLPFPRLHRTRTGDAVATFEGRAAVVLDWVEGSPLAELCPRSAEIAAAVLARTHEVLAERPVPSASPPTWQIRDVEETIAYCGRLRDHIRCLDERSTLDDLIDEALVERIDDLGRADGLRRGLPALPLETLHFDYTRFNLLFQDTTTLAGVIDLQGRPGYAAWELGKLAFEPQTVVSRDDWLDVALTAISAYRGHRGHAEIAAAARTTILYNFFSYWGISDRYDGSNRASPTGHEDYWLNRHATARLLLARLADVEAAIAAC